MNRTILIIGAIVVVVVGGGVAWFTLGRNGGSSNQQNNSTTVQTNQNQQANTQSSNQSETSTTLSALRSSGANKKCTFTSNLETGSISSGTIYVSADKKMRGDYTLKTDGTESQSSMIITKDIQYMWQPASKQGVKMSIGEMLNQNQQNPSSSQSAPGGLDTNTPFKFDCSDWRVDDAMFTPPADVTFSDMTSVMQQSSPR